MHLTNPLVSESELADTPLSLKTILRQTMCIVVPTDVSSLLWMSSQIITLSFVGRYLGEMGVAQYSASIIIFNMTGFSFIQGFGAAIDTLSSQAYGKNKKSPEVGENVQFALVLDIILGFIVCIFFFFCEPIMVVIFGEEVGNGVALFLRWAPPYLLVQIISGVMSKSMYAQKAPEIVAAANAAAAFSSPFANYFFTPLGIHGAAIALFITVGFCASAHILCALFHPKIIVREASWPTKRLLDVKSWRCFFEVGIPSVVATCAEWWAFEVQAILAAKISSHALAVHGVAMNLVSLLFSVGLGMCVSASVLVGNALGAMKPRRAKQYAFIIFTCDVILGIITGMTMIMFGRPIATLFSKEEQMISDVQSILPLVALCHIGDSMQFCLQGIFRGAGRPKEAGIAVLATLWGVGVPASAFLVFVIRVGVKGCIGGLVIGFLFEIPILYFIIQRFKWDALARKAQHETDNFSFALEAVSEGDIVQIAALVDCSSTVGGISNNSAIHLYRDQFEMQRNEDDLPHDVCSEVAVESKESSSKSSNVKFDFPEISKVHKLNESAKGNVQWHERVQVEEEYLTPEMIANVENNKEIRENTELTMTTAVPAKKEWLEGVSPCKEHPAAEKQNINN